MTSTLCDSVIQVQLSVQCEWEGEKCFQNQNSHTIWMKSSVVQRNGFDVEGWCSTASGGFTPLKKKSIHRRAIPSEQNISFYSRDKSYSPISHTRGRERGDEDWTFLKRIWQSCNEWCVDKFNCFKQLQETQNDLFWPALSTDPWWRSHFTPLTQSRPAPAVASSNCFGRVVFLVGLNFCFNSPQSGSASYVVCVCVFVCISPIRSKAFSASASASRGTVLHTTLLLACPASLALAFCSPATDTQLNYRLIWLTGTIIA